MLTPRAVWSLTLPLKAKVMNFSWSWNSDGQSLSFMERRRWYKASLHLDFMVSITAALRIFEKVQKENIILLSFPSLPPSFRLYTDYIVCVCWRERGGIREKYIDRKQHWILSYDINYKYPMTELQMEKICCYLLFFFNAFIILMNGLVYFCYSYWMEEKKAILSRK